LGNYWVLCGFIGGFTVEDGDEGFILNSMDENMESLLSIGHGNLV
jgi:hypothetical protein